MKAFGMRNDNLKKAVILFGLGTLVVSAFSVFIYFTLYGTSRNLRFYMSFILAVVLFLVLFSFFMTYSVILYLTPHVLISYINNEKLIVIHKKRKKIYINLSDIALVEYTTRPTDPSEPLPGTLIITLNNQKKIKVKWLEEIYYTYEYLDRLIKN